MDAFWHTPAALWLIAGVILIVTEAVTVPGIGLFLAGLGALCTGLLVKAGMVEESAIFAQFSWCFGLTTVWAIVLWRPLQKMRSGKQKKGSAALPNPVGETAIAGKGGLKRGGTGQAMWSGTWMNASLDTSSQQESVPEGARVKIMSVVGTTLYVILE